jgi:pyruvate,water dikinase
LYVVAQRDVAAAPLPAVGAKAATLARIADGGIPVPPFHVLSSGAFALHLAANDIRWPTSAEAFADAAHVAAVRDSIRKAPVPESVARPLLDAYEELCSASGHDQVAVRSSAGEEDSASASFAGQFSSILGVAGPAPLLDAVKECWASYLSARSLGYRAGRGIPFGDMPRFGVIVQVQVRAGKGGVAATVHPLEPDGDLLYIEANFGTGESVTSGLANPDAVSVSRSTLQVVDARIGTKRRMTRVAPEPSAGGSIVEDVDDDRRRSRVLTDAEARQIAETGLRLEELLHGPQDVEWAFDADSLWVLQSRPITALGRRGD